MNSKIICPIDMFSYEAKILLPNGNSKTVPVNEITKEIKKVIDEFECYNVHFFGNEHYLSKYVLDLKNITNYNNLIIEVN